MAKLNDLNGKIYGNWKVLYRNGSTPNKAVIWHCKCLLCGAEKDVVGSSLVNGYSTKCRSCVPKVTLSKPHRKERIYNIYNGMKQRCYNPNSLHYNDYGGRGITVCDEWKSNPDAFFEWAFANGYNDSLSIDRIDNNKGYCPDNCRWITQTNQCRNRRKTIFVNHQDSVQPLSVACKNINVSYHAVFSYRKRHDVTWQEAFDHYVI